MKTSVAAVEPLESRIAPAVILNITVNAAGVSVVEDKANAGDSQVTFTVEANGDLTIDPTDAFTQLRINGAPPLAAGDAVTLAGFAGGLKLSMGSGTDEVTLTGSFPKAVTIDLGTGAGSNDVTVANASIGGAFSVKGGTGNDSVSFSGTAVNLFGGVKLALGDGSNALVDSADTLTVNGNFSALGGKGVDDFLMDGKTVVISGKLDLNTATGNDEAGFDVTQTLQIDGGVSLKSTGKIDTNITHLLRAVNAITIGSKVTMAITNGTGHQSIVSTAGSVTIQGAAAFTIGGGQFSEVKVTADTSLAIGGAFTATTKSLDAELDVKARTGTGRINGAFTATGFLEVIGEFSGSIAGPAKIALAGGNDGYALLGTKLSDTAPLWLGAVSMTTKANGNTLALSNTVVQGALKITGSANTDSFVMDDTVLTAASSVDLGAGNDTFFIETGVFPPATSQILAPLILKGGTGDDTFNFSGNNLNATLRAVAKVTADGGAGTDTLNPGALATFVTPLVQVSIP